jgi:hypothetical protein
MRFVDDARRSPIGMVAAGRGVFVGAQVSIDGRQEPWMSAGDIHLLREVESFELFAIWKGQRLPEPIVSQLLDLVTAELGSPASNQAGARS